VSIVVVVFRARQELSVLLESIYSKTEDDVELIVIDGGSNDGTLEYLSSQDDRIDYWLSERDQGIYDAMNKAITRATGTFLLHLNAGDLLVHLPREQLLRERHGQVTLLSFPVLLDRNRVFRPAFGKRLQFENTLHHQGTFYRRIHFPGYDAAYRIFADFDVNQRLALAGARGFIGEPAVAFHATDGISAQKNAAAILEFLTVIRRNYGARAVLAARLVGKWQGLQTLIRRLRAGSPPIAG
jgi:glycosyltransferase involved in cell wall biosynthesis